MNDTNQLKIPTANPDRETLAALTKEELLDLLLRLMKASRKLLKEHGYLPLPPSGGRMLH